MPLTINYLAVVTAAVASMAIGMAWYSPMLFGKLWMSLSGLSDEKMGELKARGMGKVYATSFATSLVMAYVLAYFVQYLAIADAKGAAQLVFWAWLGFIATTMLGPVLWEGKPVKLYLLNITYQLVSLFAMALILTYWR